MLYLDKASILHLDNTCVQNMDEYCTESALEMLSKSSDHTKEPIAPTSCITVRWSPASNILFYFIKLSFIITALLILIN